MKKKRFIYLFIFKEERKNIYSLSVPVEKIYSLSVSVDVKHRVHFYLFTRIEKLVNMFQQDQPHIVLMNWDFPVLCE